MIQNLNLGPPTAGLSTLKPLSERNSKDAGSESFGKALEQKVDQKIGPNKSDQKVGPKLSSNEKAGQEEKPEAKTESSPLQRADSEKASTTEPETGQKAENRDEAIKKFMDSFESEFDIPPTRLVEAIANLDEETQLKSPEETADAVIAELDLAPEQQEKAQAMYAALLIGLSQTSPVAAASKPVMIEASQAFGAEFRQRAQASSDMRQMMNSGVDRLNQKFWMKEAPIGEATMPDVPGSGDATDTDFMDAATAEMASPTGATPGATPSKGPIELPPHLRGQLEQSASPAMMAALAAKMAELKAQSGSDESAEALPADEDAPLEKASVALPGGAALNAAKAPGEMPASADSAFAQGQETGGNDFAKNMESQKEKVSGNEKLNLKTDFKQSLKSLGELNPQAQPLKGESLAQNAAPAAGAAALAAAVPNPAENETNVRQLMNQAQYLIKKGGGEVKVKMTPEGLGEVHLKLMLQDGKVNVQMSAQSEEAKKTIESSLAELKTSLAAHKLSVEHVKVDVVGQTSADTATNNQAQTNSDPQREGTRQFWNQFNENFGSGAQRESFQEMSNLKGYSPARKSPLQPIETASTKGRAVDGKGKGLNLVA